MKLAVVTHTRGPGLWREAALESVQEWLPDYAEHLVITVDNPKKMVRARIDALKSAEYVAFVDDDDLVVDNSIALCYEALMKHPNAGVSFCHERFMYPDGKLMVYNQKPTMKHRDYLTGPTGAGHHLSIVRTSLLDFDYIERSIVDDFMGLEWFIWASVALQHGAVRVPKVGYLWRQHESAYHRQPLTQTKFAKVVLDYRAKLSELPLAKTNPPIPEFL